ncbi:LysR family transcriptional regulator [Cohaesibacter sp. CAU 1516]|uniref:LysR substrate-binding domain-containing protein n=1 Tax=Cohaesibacter sp. CAU 1516 TaxID=2576038 RepID=UPI0010FECDE0|nr:LysR substrate-binding domain-containing protein [Cohaesibacter sp. CAU 1516]TLP47153.1 LysR family transcriptional regulator [Cohaesibacter sp. CAU 1516]
MQNLNSLSLSTLRTIEVLARHATLRGAADELGVTPGALSQRLAKAEAALGQTLFIRSSTGLEPTNTCRAVASRLTATFRDLSGIVADLQQTRKNSLTVTVATIFASRWLIWRIKHFTDQNPDISLHILPANDVVDLDNSEADVGIRVGPDMGAGEGATKLLDKRVFPVCSPAIAAQVKSPADLLAFPVIRENENYIGWDAWLSDMGVKDTALKPGPTYPDGSLCLDAAMTGQGIFMAWETLACDALERGLVASPFALRSEVGSSYWFVTSKQAETNQAVKRFRCWLIRELEDSLQQWGSDRV